LYLLGSRSLPYGGHKFRYPFKTHYLLLHVVQSTLIPQVAAGLRMLSRVTWVLFNLLGKA